MNQGLKYIWRTEGFRGLFKGNGTNFVRIFPYTAVKCLSYEQITRGILWLYRQQGNENVRLIPPLHRNLIHLGAGVCGEIIARSVTYPIDMVQGRISVQTVKSPQQYRGMFHALSAILREEGPRALYKGCLPSVVGPAVSMGLKFAAFKYLNDRFQKASVQWLIKAKEQSIKTKGPELHEYTKSKQFEDSQWASKIWDVLGVSVAATVGHTVAYPFDVIHRRMQMVGWKNASSIVTGDGRRRKATLEYTGMVDAFRKTVQNEGFEALYKGWVPSLVKVGPTMAVALVTLKVLNDILEAEVSIRTM